MNDLQTARRIAEGDAAAAERLVRDHYPSVFRAMRHLTRHREDAEDLTQQAFVAARLHIHAYRGSAGLRTWLHRIAFNEYAQWKRRQRPTDPLTFDRPAADPGYGAVVEGEALLAALATLPEGQREAFVLHEIEELKVGEVAHVLRVPAGTVKARLFYARRALRALLQEKTPDPDPKEVTVHEPQEAVV